MAKHWIATDWKDKKSSFYYNVIFSFVFQFWLSLPLLQFPKCYGKWKTLKTYEVLLPSYVVRIIWQFRNHKMKESFTDANGKWIHIFQISFSLSISLYSVLCTLQISTRFSCGSFVFILWIYATIFRVQNVFLCCTMTAIENYYFSFCFVDICTMFQNISSKYHRVMLLLWCIYFMCERSKNDYKFCMWHNVQCSACSLFKMKWYFMVELEELSFQFHHK